MPTKKKVLIEEMKEEAKNPIERQEETKKAKPKKQTNEQAEKTIALNKRFLEKVSNNKVNKDLISGLLRENEAHNTRINQYKNANNSINNTLNQVAKNNKEISKIETKIEKLKRADTIVKYQNEIVRMQQENNNLRWSVIPQEVKSTIAGQTITLDKYNKLVDKQIENINTQIKNEKKVIASNNRKINYRKSSIIQGAELLTDKKLEHQLKTKDEQLPNGVSIQFNDRMTKYHMSAFARKPEGSLIKLFDDIKSTRKYIESKNRDCRVREITFVFTNKKTGKAEYRTIPITRMANMESFENAIFYMANGMDPHGRSNQQGSDPIDLENFRLNENFFNLRYYTQVNPMTLLGKRKMKDYIFLDIEATKEGCCFIDGIDKKLGTNMSDDEKMKTMMDLTLATCTAIKEMGGSFTAVDIVTFFTQICYNFFYEKTGKHFRIEIYCDYPQCEIDVMTEGQKLYTGFDKKGRSIFLQRLEYEQPFRFIKVGDDNSKTVVYLCTNSPIVGTKQGKDLDETVKKAVEVCHVDIMKGMFQYENGIYSDHAYNPYIHNDNGEIVPFEEAKKIKGSLNIYNNNIKASDKTFNLIEENRSKIRYVVIHYDCETSFDPYSQNVLIPYSLCYFTSNKTQSQPDMIKGDLNFYFSGDASINVFDKFVEDIMKKAGDHLFILNAYNGSKFDHWFLLRSLEKYDLLDRIFMNGNQILNVKFGGRHCSFDLCKLVNKSLHEACSSFNTFNKKIEGFNHNEIQEYYNENKNVTGFFHEKPCDKKNITIKASAKIDMKKKITSIAIDESDSCKCKKFEDLFNYNKMDVLALAELYELVDKVLKPHIPDNKCLFDFKTIGSFVFKLFNNKKSEEGVKTPEYDNLQIYDLIRSSLFAGRCQCFWNDGDAQRADGKAESIIFYDLTGKDSYAIIDVVSLYPYVMTRRKYPCGKMIFYNDPEIKNKKWILKSTKEIFAKGLMGFFFCKQIDQSNLKKKIIPVRQRSAGAKLQDGLLNWASNEIIRDIVLNSVDICCLLKNGCQVIIDEDHLSNHYFTEVSDDANKADSQSMFKTVLQPFEDDKKLQDHYKEIADERYNPAQREMDKAILNNLSGKVGEQPKYQKTSYVKTLAQLDEIIKSANVETIKVLENFGENKSIIQFDVKDKEECMKETNRPFYLAIFIYAYAREHMYESLIRDYDVGYMDTDSGFMRKSELERMIKEKPHLFGSDFGQFDIETSKKTKKKEFPCLVTIAPKNYFCLDYKLDGSLMVAKKGFKGINIEKDIYLSKDILKKYFDKVSIKHRNDDGTRTIETYYDKKQTNNGCNDFKLYSSILEQYRLDKDKNVVAFIEDMIKNKKAYIFTSSLLKQKRATDKMEGFNLYQRYMIKMISVNVKEDSNNDIVDD